MFVSLTAMVAFVCRSVDRSLGETASEEVRGNNKQEYDVLCIVNRAVRNVIIDQKGPR